jgi:hypothetical protein
MNKKITGIFIILITIFFLICVLLFNKTISYEKLLINENEYNEMISNRNYSSDLKINRLNFNGYDLILDDNENKWYYSLIKNTTSSYNPKVKYETSNDAKISILENKITDELIEKSETITLIVYDSYEYNIYFLVCTTLPLLNISYDDNLTITKSEEISMNMYLFDNRSSAKERVTTSTGKIKLRGSSSIAYPKKGFKISLTKESVGGNVRKNDISLLGMRKDDDWILYAGYNDCEKVRNVFSSNLWYESLASDNLFNVTNGMKYEYVELFLNNEYWGLYALGFPIDEKQLNLSKDEYSTYDEYIFKKINWSSEIDSIENGDELKGYEIVSKNSNNGFKLLENYYKKLLQSNDITCLYKIVDINNLIDYYLFNNLIQGSDNPRGPITKNVYITMKKYNGEYVALYTPWDLDMSFGNLWYSDAKNYTLSYYFDYEKNFITELNSIYYLQQLNDDNIYYLIKNKYNYLRENYWSNDNISKLIDEYQDTIYNSGAFVRDMNKWPDGNYNDPNEKLSKFKEYVLQRLNYTDDFINTMGYSYNINEYAISNKN